jgi:hypothetical protein
MSQNHTSTEDSPMYRLGKSTATRTPQELRTCSIHYYHHHHQTIVTHELEWTHRLLARSPGKFPSRRSSLRLKVCYYCIYSAVTPITGTLHPSYPWRSQVNFTLESYECNSDVCWTTESSYCAVITGSWMMQKLHWSPANAISNMDSSSRHLGH